MSRPSPIDFGILLNLAFGAFKEALHADMANGGFDGIGASFGYVLRLLNEGPSTLTEVAQQLGMTLPGALKVIDEMVAKGYIERRPDAEDGRVKRLLLSRRGRCALARARDFHVRTEQALAKQLGPRRVATARAVLEAMANLSSDTLPRVARPL